MRLAFLFLPFIGHRDYSNYKFYVDGPRFVHKYKSESCIICRNVIKIHHDSYKYMGTVSSAIVTYECSLRKNVYKQFTTNYEKHPCDAYHERGQLKRLL